MCTLDAALGQRNVLLLLVDSPVVLQAGRRVRVQAMAALASAQPRYEFTAWVQDEGVDHPTDGMKGCEAAGWRPVGQTVAYPEAAMNVNDAMDALMAAAD